MKILETQKEYRPSNSIFQLHKHFKENKIYSIIGIKKLSDTYMYILCV